MKAMKLQGRRKGNKETEWGKLLYGIPLGLFAMSEWQANVDILPQDLLLAGLGGRRRGKKSCKQWYNSRKDKKNHADFLYMCVYVCLFVYIFVYICVFTHTYILIMCQENIEQNMQLS